MSTPEDISVLGRSKSAKSGEAFVVGFGVPLAMVQQGKLHHVSGIRGKGEVKSFLQNLGFAEGAEVTLISEIGGDVIVNVKGTRVAISRAMATKILTV